MVIIDLLVLIVFTGVVSGLNLSLVQVVPHRENRQTVTGVRGVSIHWTGSLDWCSVIVSKDMDKLTFMQSKDHQSNQPVVN